MDKRFKKYEITIIYLIRYKGYIFSSFKNNTVKYYFRDIKELKKILSNISFYKIKDIFDLRKSLKS